MAKYWIFAVLALIALLYFMVYHSYSGGDENKLQSWSDARVDRTCESSEDCVVKTTGCDCGGLTYGCLSKVSVDGICGLPSSKLHTCNGTNTKPDSCSCVKGRCTGVFKNVSANGSTI